MLQATDSPVAKQALEKIAQLYAIEKAIRGKLKEQRLVQRQKQSVPLLAEYHAWLKAQFGAVLSKSGLGLAIAYSLNRWQALIYYAQDGQVEMDNNIIEREIRPIALGKKNWLFAGSDNGGHRAAAMYTLLNTAKLNGINLQQYLEYVLARINDHKINQIDQLLPWNVTLAKKVAPNQLRSRWPPNGGRHKMQCGDSLTVTIARLRQSLHFVSSSAHLPEAHTTLLCFLRPLSPKT